MDGELQHLQHEVLDILNYLKCTWNLPGSLKTAPSPSFTNPRGVDVPISYLKGVTEAIFIRSWKTEVSVHVRLCNTIHILAPKDKTDKL